MIRNPLECNLVFRSQFHAIFSFDDTLDPARIELKFPLFRSTHPSEQPRYVSMNEVNPLLKPSSLPLRSPEFGRVKNEHFLPAFEVAMREQLEEVALIAELKESPTFENTLVALEKTGETLNRVQAVFFHLASAHTNEDIQEIEAKWLLDWQLTLTISISTKNSFNASNHSGTNAKDSKTGTKNSNDCSKTTTKHSSELVQTK